MQQDYRQVLRYGFGILAVIAGFMLVIFVSTSFQSFIALFEVFRQERILVRNPHDYGFSSGAYWTTINFLALLLTSSILFFFYLYPRRSGWAIFQLNVLVFPFKKLKEQWILLPKYEKIIIIFFLLILVITKCYLVRFFPLLIDEAATYVLFLYKGFVASASYYPIPNNHILYTILCLPFTWLFNDPFWALRLPSILISLALFPAMYLGLRSVLSFPAVLITVAGCSFSYYTLYYSVHGRGYSLLLFLTFIASISLLKVVQQKDSSYWFLFMLASIAGFYTIPVFLYPFGALLIFAAVYFFATKNNRAIVMLVIGATFISLATILLFLPVMLVSGADQLYGNEYVESWSWQKLLLNLPFYLSYTQGAMLGQETIGAYVWLAGIIASCFILVLYKRLQLADQNSGLQQVIFLALCGAISPLLFILVQGVLPPERVWIFKVFYDFLFLGILFQFIFSSILKVKIQLIKLITIIFVLAFSGYQLNKLYRDLRLEISRNNSFKQNIDTIQEYGNHQIFSDYAPYRFHLLYYFLSKDIPFIFDEFVVRPGRNYNVLILEPKQAVPSELDLSRYYLKFQDHSVQIYFIKNSGNN